MLRACYFFLVIAGIAVAFANEVGLRGASRHQVLQIDQCAMKVPGGKATLILSALRRTNDIFGGEFQMKVKPYFFKNDNGTLAITITDASIAKAAKGSAVDITGIATTAGKNGVVRHINAVATPVDGQHGALKLWFTDEDDRKMVFETKYRFVE